MQDHIPDALITAFERQYDSSWNDPQLRKERLAMRYGWAAAMEAKPCLHQIQEPAPATAMDALREAEAALEVAMARILKADPGHSICVTSEAKALVAVRAALAAPAPMLVAQPQLHAALFAARGALQHMKEGGKPTQSLLNEAIAAIDSVAVTQAAPAAVAVPDAVRDAEKLLRAEAARLARIYGSNKWYGFSAEKESYLEHLRAAAALAATPAAAPAVLPEPDAAIAEIMELVRSCVDRAVTMHTVPTLGINTIESKLTTLLAGVSAPAAQAVPDGWREKFAADVYADLAAADNQDVPLEEYPARILKVLDSIVGPRHPVVIKWRNDAIRNCIAIAYKYCRDPESHKYLKQDLEAMLTTEPAPQAQAVERGEVLVTVSGFTGSGKSAIAGEIEIMCRALGLQVEWPDGESEKNMTHADWTAALEQYKPRVRIVEQNIPFVSKKGLSK